MDEVVKSLDAKGLSDATINRYLSAVSTFLKWCEEREYRTTKLPSYGWRDEDEGRIRWITAAS
jgi:site-specific recombinase XerD